MAKIHKTLKSRKPQSFGDKVFDACVIIILSIIAAIVAYPMLYVVSCSISDPDLTRAGQIWLLPKGITFTGYKEIFGSSKLIVGYRNTIIYTVVGTTLSVVATVMAGYALSRKDLYGRKFINWFIAIPMWFSGGLIPTYLVMHKIGLVNNPIIIVLIGLVSSYNIIICRTFFSTLPYELQEAAMIDGASDFQVLRNIVLPVAMPIIAVLSLYYAVGLWNSYFTPMIYLNEQKYQPLQVFLREILLLNSSMSIDEATTAVNMEKIMEQQRMAQTMKYALIVVATVPLLVVYPLLQKYFAKGVMVGSIKG